ncbi:MAG: hypothetical protein JWN78_1765 [Bacteroidota bacterium]|nr:hypothetical protein [Bacteroidota bacterium]
MRKIIISLLTLLLKAALSFSQSQTKMPDSMKTTVIIFDDDGNHGYVTTTPNGKKEKKKRSFPKNNAKVGLFGPAYGEVQFYYERYLTNWLTVQGGLGLATRDFVGELYMNGGLFRSSNIQTSSNWNGPDEYDAPDEYSSYQFRKAGVGICASIAPRFYVAGDADDFDGFYLSPVFEYAIRNYKVQKVNASGNRLPNDKMKEKVNSIYFFLTMGWQNNFEPIVLDWSLSVGLWKYKANRLDIGYTQDPVTSDIVYGNKEVTFSRLRPYFRMNLDLGGVFGKKKK